MCSRERHGVTFRNTEWRCIRAAVAGMPTRPALPLFGISPGEGMRGREQLTTAKHKTDAIFT